LVWGLRDDNRYKRVEKGDYLKKERKPYARLFKIDSNPNGTSAPPGPTAPARRSFWRNTLKFPQSNRFTSRKGREKKARLIALKKTTEGVYKIIRQAYGVGGRKGHFQGRRKVLFWQKKEGGVGSLGLSREREGECVWGWEPLCQN